MVWAIAFLSVWGVLGVVGDRVLSMQHRLVKIAVARVTRGRGPRPSTSPALRLLAQVLTFFVGCPVSAIFYGINIYRGTWREHMRDSALATLEILSQLDEQHGYSWCAHCASMTVETWYQLGRKV
jgi:hypothetical protein